MTVSQGPGEVRPEQASELVARGALLVDVRAPEEWEAGRAPQAVHIPLASLGSRLGELPRDRQIVTVCRSGARSGNAAAFLRGAGYEAANLEGGLKAWQRHGLPLEPRDGRVA